MTGTVATALLRELAQLRETLQLQLQHVRELAAEVRALHQELARRESFPPACVRCGRLGKTVCDSCAAAGN